MVSKRRLGASLLLLGLAFVGAFHAVAAVAFGTGLAQVGAGLAGISLLSLVVVNLPALGESGGDE
ncbi:hypothetical protein [Halorussus halophilus]|uniref:hypothetical protein n=1 Tax=Halorussus halophilus TaxID=2650975 RepID=UPI0013017391|nr:hypothetical protein [Halorussus halophilus]